ncbi:MAG: hypothetical protein K9M51_04185 [Candidatus Gracilibacteria bacterium]|nr:hypothetical protein [Candidatus Gracilibacteria bacterium]
MSKLPFLSLERESDRPPSSNLNRYREDRKNGGKRYQPVSHRDEEKNLSPNELVEHNLRFTDAVARTFSHGRVHVDPLDIIQESNLRILEIAKSGKFIPGRTRFIQYISGTCLLATERVIRDATFPISIPPSSKIIPKKENILRLDAPSHKTNGNRENTHLLKHWNSKTEAPPQTLEESFDFKDTQNEGDVFLEQESVHLLIQCVLKDLSFLERRILTLSYGLERKMESFFSLEDTDVFQKAEFLVEFFPDENKLKKFLEVFPSLKREKKVPEEIQKLKLRKKDLEKITRYLVHKEKPELSLQDIGNILDLSAERVRQIKEKGLRRLRHGPRSDFLSDGLSDDIIVPLSPSRKEEIAEYRRTIPPTKPQYEILQDEILQAGWEREKKLEEPSFWSKWKNW